VNDGLQHLYRVSCDPSGYKHLGRNQGFDPIGDAGDLKLRWFCTQQIDHGGALVGLKIPTPWHACEEIQNILVKDPDSS
jgi:hypothetical protein